MPDRNSFHVSTLSPFAAWSSRFLPPGAAGTLAIGTHKSAVTLLVLERRRLLERRLGPFGYDVTWTRYSSAPALLEAMRDGLIDIAYSGATLPILAVARGAPIVALANDLPSPRSTAIVVADASPISRLSELRGRTVAFDHDSTSEWLLLSALRKAGLGMADIVPLPLTPAKAEVAFRTGAADVWVVSDLQLAAAEAAGGRILADATGIMPHCVFYVARRDVAERAPEVLQAVMRAVAETEADIAARRPEVSAELAPIVGLPAPTLNLALARRTWGIASTDEAALAEQQRIADYFAETERIPEWLDAAVLANPRRLPIGVG